MPVKLDEMGKKHFEGREQNVQQKVERKGKKIEGEAEIKKQRRKGKKLGYGLYSPDEGDCPRSLPWKCRGLIQARNA
jgi:hypothetical protein